MVARLDACQLVRRMGLGLLLAVSTVASASVEEGRAAFEAYESALQKQQEAVARGDSNTYAAQAELAKASLEQARTAYETGDAALSADPAVLRGYTDVLRAMGYDDLAAETLSRALDRGIADPGLWRIYGESLLAIGPGHLQDGVDALHRALALDGTGEEAVRAWSALGKYYLDHAMPGEAANAFDKSLAIDAGYVPARLGNAAVHVFDGDVGEAGRILDDVGRAAQPYDTMLRGMMRVALYDFDNARRVFDDTAENHYAYARMLYLAARLPEAVLAARRATDLAGDRVDIWNLLGAMQIQLGEYGAAAEAYEASLAIKADQPGLRETIEQLKAAQAEAAAQATGGNSSGQPQSAPAPAQQGEQPLQGQGPLR